ncbi:MAG: hypothetical protein ACMG57_01485 [Candidatus Dojkabacteria bacterium]
MAQQTLVDEKVNVTEQIEVKRQIMPGLIEDPNINIDTQRLSIFMTLNALADRLISDLKSGEPINIIFPMDGSLLVKQEFERIVLPRLTAEQIEMLSIIISAKTRTPKGEKKYLLFPEDANSDYRTYVLDDIFDHGFLLVFYALGQLQPLHVV